MNFQLSNCVGYVPPDPYHPLALSPTPLCGLPWHQKGTELSGRTLRTQCTFLENKQGARCHRSTTFDYRYCHVHLRELFNLMICPTTIPGLKGWGCFAVTKEEYNKSGLDNQKRPVLNEKCVVFRKGELIGGDNCFFVGELISTSEAERRYPDPLCGDYLIGEHKQLIDGQVARTVLQFSNDALNVKTGLRNTPKYIKMPDWPIVQNADGVEFEGRIYLVALKNICHGEEITWNYSGDSKVGQDYWAASNHSNGQATQRHRQENVPIAGATQIVTGKASCCRRGNAQ